MLTELWGSISLSPTVYRVTHYLSFRLSVCKTVCLTGSQLLFFTTSLQFKGKKKCISVIFRRGKTSLCLIIYYYKNKSFHDIPLIITMVEAENWDIKCHLCISYPLDVCYAQVIRNDRGTKHWLISASEKNLCYHRLAYK